MALISDTGLPIFSKKRGECSVVSVSLGLMMFQGKIPTKRFISAAVLYCGITVDSSNVLQESRQPADQYRV